MGVPLRPDVLERYAQKRLALEGRGVHEPRHDETHHSHSQQQQRGSMGRSSKGIVTHQTRGAPLSIAHVGDFVQQNVFLTKCPPLIVPE